MYAPKEILTQFNIVKQAADLHSNFFCQKILHRYLMTYDLDDHIRKIIGYTGKTAGSCVISSMTSCPARAYTPGRRDVPAGNTPPGISSRAVFDQGCSKKSLCSPVCRFMLMGADWIQSG